jgi:hypothetical protein
MPTQDALRVCIDVDRRSLPVSGRVLTEHGSARCFTGWTELFTALEAVIADDNERGDTRAQDL